MKYELEWKDILLELLNEHETVREQVGGRYHYRKKE